MVSHVLLNRNPRSKQRGVVLIVGLIMVLLISIVALASIRGSGLQEAMAGNMRDRGLAFQTSEAALANGEDIVFNNNLICDGIVRAGARCWTNLDAIPANSAQYFDATGFANFGNLSTLALGANTPPRFVLEELETYQPDDGSARDESASNPFKITAYKVTSNGGGISPDSQVIIQSTFTRPAR